MRARREVYFVFGVVLVFLALQSLPFVYASLQSNDELAFGGFLLNPIDGNTYLAKMRQGFAGSWLYSLAYTAEPGEAVPLNTFFLLLGHIARLTRVSLLTVFHSVRLLSALVLSLSLYRFCGAVFEDRKARRFAFVLGTFGSGMGWLALPFVDLPPDFWVAEAYPFLASFDNAHFPLGLALQVWLVTPLGEGISRQWRYRAGNFLAAILLASFYPFGLAVAGAVLAGEAAWRAWQRLPLAQDVEKLAALALGGAPILAYQLMLVQSHPVLSAWNAQNVTQSPPILQTVVAFLPALALALPGAYFAWGQRLGVVKVLPLWLLVGFALIYLPLDLQRRLISGLYIPVACLAVLALQALTRQWRRWNWAPAALFVLALPTNLIILLGGAAAARGRDPTLYVFRSELAAYEWLNENSPAGALVMAAPDSGLLLPAYTQARVIYGHPFETVDAEAQRELVLNFYEEAAAGQSTAQSAASLMLDYVLYGPREQVLGPRPELPGWVVAFEEGDVLILQVEP